MHRVSTAMMQADRNRAFRRSGNPCISDAQLARLRPDLLRFAVLHLRNHEMAEDVVQEAILAALAARNQFDHRASVKTWVFKILRNKIVDVFRDCWNKKRIGLDEVAADETTDDVLPAVDSRWQAVDTACSWADPEQVYSAKQLWEECESCMSEMPEATRRVFVMRELLGMTIEEICKELAITPSNCWVILHRARIRLRLCMQQHLLEREEAI